MTDVTRFSGGMGRIRNLHLLPEMIENTLRGLEDVLQQLVGSLLLDGPIAANDIWAEFLPENSSAISPRSTVSSERKSPPISASRKRQAGRHTDQRTRSSQFVQHDHFRPSVPDEPENLKQRTNDPPV